MVPILADNYLLSISNMFLADELAILQITKSMKYFKERHLMVSYAKSANNIAISYIYLGKYKKATALLEESIHIFSDMCSISVHYPTYTSVFHYLSEIFNDLSTLRKLIIEYSNSVKSVLAAAINDLLLPLANMQEIENVFQRFPAHVF